MRYIITTLIALGVATIALAATYDGTITGWDETTSPDGTEEVELWSTAATNVPNERKLTLSNLKSWITSLVFSPTNYTAGSTSILSHLEGIDVALASAGGSVDLTGTNDLANTGQLLNADYISSGYLLVSTNITDHNTGQLSGVSIVTTNWTLNTNWVGNYPVGLTVAGTDGTMALVGTSEGGHSTVFEHVEIDPTGTSLVDKWVWSKAKNADGGYLETFYGDMTDPLTIATQQVYRVQPSGASVQQGQNAVMAFRDRGATTGTIVYGLGSDENKMVFRKYVNTDVDAGGSTTLGTFDTNGKWWMPTLSVSNSITAKDTAAFGGLIASTTNRTLAAATVLNPAPAQVVAQGTEGYVALIGGPEGNFSTLLDFTETSEDGSTLTDKWTLAKRTYSSNSSLAFYYGPNADLSSNTNVAYLTKEGDTWNKRNASVGGNLTVATNVTVGGVVNGAGTATLTNFIAVAAKDTLNGYPSVALVSGATDQTGIDVSGTTSSWKFNGARYYRFATSGFYPNDANASYTLGIGVRPWSYLYANTNYAIGFYTDASNYARSSLSHDGTSTTTLAGETSGTGTDAQSLKIKLAGNGALYVDGDTAGNARGANAVDLQVNRSAATQVASGDVSFAVGRNNTSSGYGSSAMGFAVTASGNYSLAAGRSSVASGEGSVAVGLGSNATLYYQQAYAAGVFGGVGDAQGSRLVMRNTTTGSSADLFLDGSSARAVIPANTTWMFEITVSARSTDGGTGDEESAAYKYTGCIERDGANNTALVGTVTETIVARDDTDWTVVVSADDTNEALDINVTSDDANTVRWVAVITLTEVGG